MDDKELKEAAEHLAQHAAHHLMQGAGCMITFFAIITFFGTVSALVVILV